MTLDDEWRLNRVVPDPTGSEVLCAQLNSTETDGLNAGDCEAIHLLNASLKSVI